MNRTYRFHIPHQPFNPSGWFTIQILDRNERYVDVLRAIRFQDGDGYDYDIYYRGALDKSTGQQIIQQAHEFLNNQAI